MTYGTVGHQVNTFTYHFSIFVSYSLGADQKLVTAKCLLRQEGGIETMGIVSLI